jgi:hypothetical protein
MHSPLLGIANETFIEEKITFGQAIGVAEKHITYYFRCNKFPKKRKIPNAVTQKKATVGQPTNRQTQS